MWGGKCYLRKMCFKFLDLLYWQKNKIKLSLVCFSVYHAVFSSKLRVHLEIQRMGYTKIHLVKLFKKITYSPFYCLKYYMSNKRNMYEAQLLFSMCLIFSQWCNKLTCEQYSPLNWHQRGWSIMIKLENRKRLISFI